MSSNLMSQTSSIAALRKAEKQAADKINDARKRKQKRLKQAKEEAKLEVEKFKETMEKQFQSRQSEELGNKDEFQSSVNEITDQELKKVNNSVRNNQNKALKKILAAIFNIEPKLHVNFKDNN